MNLKRATLFALTVLALVPVMGAAAPYVTPNTPIEATELYRVSSPITLGGSAIKVDGAGQLFSAAVTYNGNVTTIDVKEYSPTGALLGAWPVIAPPVSGGFNKEDSVSLSATGADLLVGMTSHLTSNRDYPFEVARIPGVYVPYTVAQPEDAPGAYTPPASGSQGLTDADVSRVAQAVATIEAPQFQRVIDNMKSKARGAIDEAFDGEHGSYPVWRQLLDTGYKSSTDALRDYRTPTPTAHP